MKALGKHVLIELYDCNESALNSLDLVKSYMNNAVTKSGATIVGSTFHMFSPQGVSGSVVIAESHFSIHTWPEYKYAAIDLFTCGDSVEPWVAFEYLEKAFESKSSYTMALERGNLEVTPRGISILESPKREEK